MGNDNSTPTPTPEPEPPKDKATFRIEIPKFIGPVTNHLYQNAVIKFQGEDRNVKNTAPVDIFFPPPTTKIGLSRTFKLYDESGKKLEPVSEFFGTNNYVISKGNYLIN